MNNNNIEPEINGVPQVKETSNSNQFDANEIKRIVEALLFANSEPTPLKKLHEVISESHPIDKKELANLIEELKNEYQEQNRGFQLDQIANGYLLRTRKELYPYLETLQLNKRKDRLSPAATEVLAIIAFRQPITKSQIEEIRGVDSSGVLHNLQERGLIHTVGTLDVPGRPTLFGTTHEFLNHFGLKNIKDLKSLSEKNLSSK